MGEHPAIPRTRDMVANLLIRGKIPRRESGRGADAGLRERKWCDLLK